MIKRISGMLVFACCMLFFPVTADAAPPGAISSEPIAPGVVQEIYNWPTSYGNARIGVWKCDLTNPLLDMQLVAGAGSYTKRATVSQMSERTNAVAMMNGDYFNMALQGSPIGPSLINGKLQSSPAVIIGLYSLGIDSNNTAHIEPIIFQGKVTARNGKTYPIDGLNKTYYWHDPSGQESHTETIQMYNDFWTSASRGHKTNSEILVKSDGLVEKISWGKNFPFAVPKGKYILQVNGQAEAFFKKNVKEGQYIKIDIGVSPDRDWKFLVGGHALVLKDGVVQNYTKDINVLGGVRARSAAGISQDGKTIYFVAAEGRTSRSVGLGLKSLGQFMNQLGCTTAVNLDGGGSTTMVTTPLGSFTRDVTIVPERYGAQRPVVNGIGIFNNTPVGPITGVKMGGPTQMVIGESASFPVTHAWDGMYHAKDPNQASFSYSEYNNLGAWGGNWFLALHEGDTIINVSMNEKIVGSKQIKILGSEGIKRLYLDRSAFQVQPGSEVAFTLKALTKDGRTVQLSPRVAEWTVSGFDGVWNSETGVFRVENLNDVPNGVIIARVGDLEAKTFLGNPDYHLLDMYIDQTQYWLDGSKKQLEQPPIIQNGRTLVPLRFVTEVYGGDIEWDGEDKSIHIEYRGNDIEMHVGDTTAYVNGQAVQLDVPPVIISGRTLVPVRFISESLNMTVSYDDKVRCVRISEKIA